VPDGKAAERQLLAIAPLFFVAGHHVAAEDKTKA
jgi:hypothetical protein